MFHNNIDVGKAEHQRRIDKVAHRISPSKRRRDRWGLSSHPIDQVLGLTAEQVIAKFGRPAINRH